MALFLRNEQKVWLVICTLVLTVCIGILSRTSRTGVSEGSKLAFALADAYQNLALTSTGRVYVTPTLLLTYMDSQNREQVRERIQERKLVFFDHWLTNGGGNKTDYPIALFNGDTIILRSGAPELYRLSRLTNSFLPDQQ
jgi:hypothetical protein